jgi:hypothetical protein
VELLGIGLGTGGRSGAGRGVVHALPLPPEQVA